MIGRAGSPPPWASPPTIHVRHRSAPRPSSATNTLENLLEVRRLWTTSHRQAATWTPLGPTAAHKREAAVALEEEVIVRCARVQ